MEAKVITAKGEWVVECKSFPSMENIYQNISFGNIQQKVLGGSRWTDFEFTCNTRIFTNFQVVGEHKFIIIVYKNENCFFIDENFSIKEEGIKTNWNEDSTEMLGLTVNYTVAFSNPSVYNLDSLDVKVFKNKKEIGSVLKKYLAKKRLKNYENN